jgi:hypothetical protein
MVDARYGVFGGRSNGVEEVEGKLRSLLYDRLVSRHILVNEVVEFCCSHRWRELQLLAQSPLCDLDDLKVSHLYQCLAMSTGASKPSFPALMVQSQRVLSGAVYASKSLQDAQVECSEGDMLTEMTDGQFYQFMMALDKADNLWTGRAQ